MAMRDEFELSGSQFFSPCGHEEAEVMQLLQACAPAGQAQVAKQKAPGSAAVCPGGRGDAHQAASSSGGPKRLEVDTVVSSDASVCRAAGHVQPAASSGTDRGTGGWAGEGECACSGREGAARAHHAPLAASEPDRAPGLSGSHGSAPPDFAAAEACGGPCAPAEGNAAVEASNNLSRAAGAGMGRSPVGAGAAGMPAHFKAPARGELEQGPQHGRGLGRAEGKPAAGTDQGGGRRHAPLRWAEAGYLPSNPLVRTAIGALAHCAFFCLCSCMHVCCHSQGQRRWGQHHGAVACWTSYARHEEFLEMHMQLCGRALHPSCLPHIHALACEFKPPCVLMEREVHVLQQGVLPKSWLGVRVCARSGRCMCCSRAAACSACCWRASKAVCSGGLQFIGQRTAWQLKLLPSSFADAVTKYY